MPTKLECSIFFSAGVCPFLNLTLNQVLSLHSVELSTPMTLLKLLNVDVAVSCLQKLHSPMMYAVQEVQVSVSAFLKRNF